MIVTNGFDGFTAIFQDGSVHVGGKVYNAGSCSVQLLNQFNLDCSALRITSQSLRLSILQNTMQKQDMAVGQIEYDELLNELRLK